MIENFNRPLRGASDLVTTYEETRKGFLMLALEKNRKATPYVQEGKALKSIAEGVLTPRELLNIRNIYPALLLAAGISDKASKILNETDKKEAIMNLIENFLEPAGNRFSEELVYRFLLTRGDSLGGSMRNLVGAIAERKFVRALISNFSIFNLTFYWLDNKSKQWILGNYFDTEIEFEAKGLAWEYNGSHRTILFNINVPIVKKNIDICLFKNHFSSFNVKSLAKCSNLKVPENYLALGELKGGMDPAGADEHWKTANSALNRIRTAFNNYKPSTFFIGAAIEKSMSEEIWNQLVRGELSMVANLNIEQQLFSLCRWIINY